ncbi:heterokaryon incompatibility protein-domain-containing protein, partial [Immersiella caudata]
MRLINVRTLELEDFTAPPDSYAILSHTWGNAQDEVSYQDFQDPKRRKKKPGFAKIETTCSRAKEDNLSYAWVDTCCIDKSSSAELSEAINSMFEWYKLSSVCYVFLEDVDGTPTWSLYSSRWFTRGWTLQELIAPRVVEFYNCRWQCLGTKETLGGRLSEGAGIPLSILNGAPLDTVCVGQRMEWAARRKTTRKEDMAYCLMGIFNVNMPMLYGEGDKAFQRLQEEIIRQYDDHSIFAWQEDRNEESPSVVRGILAKSPAEF